MEAIIFCGIQATGKSSFYQQHFFATHVRISLDLLNTRNREDIFLDACLRTSQKFVIDNTNLTVADRAKYISLAKQHQYQIRCYYFQSNLGEALIRNNTRSGKALIPEKGVRGAYNRLQIPSPEEGFDEMFYVTIKDNQFDIKPWQHEI
ncbi:MAG: AAA family ATPase [Chitinophaga sp.]|uniref:AAA family ATPase n=1 Tax=Chitinophaga sp. TaxID=1869181 RepID=UPI0025C5C20D|nr:AAA family ATPase [Chitinophaga sp.]MBV8253374.1 AAA family ATPase [Chitinophaga sp.]